MKYSSILVVLIILASLNNFAVVTGIPPLPFTVGGWVYFAGDGTVANASVMVKNLRTGIKYNDTTNSNGVYSIEIDDWEYGDELFIEAFFEEWYGNASYIIEEGYSAVVNITLYRTIIPPNIIFSPSFSNWTNGKIIVNVTISDDDGVNRTRFAWSNSKEKPSIWNEWQMISNNSYSFQAQQENEGIWYLHVEAYDNEGNYEWKYGGAYKIDKSPPVSYVTKFSSYIQSIPFVVKAEANDELSGISYVKLFYRYSPDNLSWSPWLLYGIANETYQWSFNAPNGSGYYQFYSIACDNVGNEEIKSQEDKICFATHPPCKPFSPYPENGSIDVPMNITLSWECNDIDGDEITYDIYLGDEFPLQKIAENITSTNFSVTLTHHKTTYYWQVVAWDAYGAKNISQIWHFTTKINHPPNCSIEANPLVGAPPLNVTFFMNAGDVDGYIISWQIDIDGDDSIEYEGNGEPPKNLVHEYDVGFYIVKLIVRDDDGAEAYDTINITVSHSPSPPVLNGPTYGYTNISYSLEALSNDPDGDKIRYGFDWNNDSVVDEWTGWCGVNETVICNHSWENEGSYAIKVIAEDENGVRSEWSNILEINITKPAFNFPPYQPINPSPFNGEKNVSLNPVLRVYVYDPDGDKLNVSFYDENDNLIGKDYNVSSGSYANVTWNNLQYNKTYRWYAIISDGKESNVSQIWQFTTKINHPPFIINVSPENGSMANISINISFTVIDKEGDKINFILDTNFGIVDVKYNVTNGSFSYHVSLQYNKTYYWNITIWDAYNTNNYSFYFTTINEIYSYEVFGSPHYNDWLSIYTPIKIVSNAEKVYYRIWHNGWHPLPGEAYGKNNSFWLYNGSFALNKFNWTSEGLYYMEFYGENEGLIHNISFYVDSTPPSTNITASLKFTNEKNITLSVSSIDDVGIKEVEIYYSYSETKNWVSWTPIGEYNNASFNITFNFNITGFYAFVGVARDLLNNTEIFPEEPYCMVRYYTTDFNEDNKTNVLDLIKLIKYWGTEKIEYDLNGDGIIDVKDLLLLLQEWTG